MALDSNKFKFPDEEPDALEEIEIEIKKYQIF